jgi:hypothetical protein
VEKTNGHGSRRFTRAWCVASLQNSVAILDGFAHLQIEKKEKETTNNPKIEQQK